VESIATSSNMFLKGEVPAHAGVVRYAKEKGIEVPKRLFHPIQGEVGIP